MADAIVKRLGPERAVSIYLDELNPPKAPVFTALQGTQYVIGELFSGQERTGDPQSWLRYFPGYRKISIKLEVSFEVGLQRYLRRPKRFQNLGYWTPERYAETYRRFHEEAKMTGFASKAGIEEIVIENDKATAEEVSERIISLLSERS